MKKLPLILMGILTLAIIVTYINAQENSPTRVQFEESLQGFFVQSPARYYGEWEARDDEIIIGSGSGDLSGLPITFTIVANRRFNAEEDISFIDGDWTFVLSDSSISGHFKGNGTTLTEFSGRFVSTMSQQNSVTHPHDKISGEFRCWFTEPSGYGDPWRYDAWWNGTLREGET